MAKYIDIENATLSWNEADKEGVGDDFIGGVLFALDCLTAKEEDIVRCEDCIIGGYCSTESTFKFVGIEDGFCRVGKRKETT
jgi:hypothetical protein